MHFREALTVAALAASLVLAGDPSVNVYWGQAGDGDLATACASDAFEYITLSFVNLSPENGGPTGYPGTNFAAHCWATVYTVDGEASELLSDCKVIQAGIAPCQQLGKKVLLSVGGVASSVSNYTVSSAENGIEFAYFLYGAFGPYVDTWGDAPRPFDDTTDGVVHNAVDGYDFDIESYTAGDVGYVAMIDTLRELITNAGRDDIITGAPQCPLDPNWQPMLYMLQNAQFDRLFIQFYNNEGCQILDAEGQWNPNFNYAEWEEFLSATPSKNAKLHIGLPGDDSAIGAGYVNSTVVNTVACEYSEYPMFGGLMFWDQWSATQNINADGVSYLDSIKLGCGGEQPTTTSTTVVSTSTTSSSSTPTPPVTTTSSSSSSSSTPTDVPSCGIPGWDTAGVDIGYYTDASYISFDGCTDLCTATSGCLSFAIGEQASPPACVLYSHVTLGYTNVDAAAPYIHFDYDGACPVASSPSSSTFSVTSTSSSSTVLETSSSSSYVSSVTITTSSGISSSSSYVSSTSTSTESSTERFSTSTPVAYNSTSAIPTSTSSSSSYLSSASTESSTQSSNASTSAVTSSDYSLTSSSSYSTYSTLGRSNSTTSSDLPSSTWIPVTRTSSASSIPTLTSSIKNWSNSTWTTSSPSSSSISDSTSLTTSAPEDSTSTIYTTTVYTVTSCPPSVPNCPGKGSVTTEVVPVSTTVCPVSGTETPGTAKPTESSGSSSPSGSESSASSSVASFSYVSYETLTSSSSPVESSAASSAASVSFKASTSTHAELFSTITISIKPFPTATGGYVPPVNNSAGTGTGYSIKPNPTPSTMRRSKPVTAGAGRNSVAVGVPALVVALAMML